MMHAASLPAGRTGFGAQRLAVYAMLLVLGIGLVQVIASILFYEAIDEQALRQDHARRVAEMLVVSDRVHRIDPRETARLMSSHYLDVRVMAEPSLNASGKGRAIDDIRTHIHAWEPALASRPLHLDIVRGDRGLRDLAGAMQLPDGQWLDFRSRDISTGWPIVLRATAMTLLITLLCMAAGFLALRMLTAPLRRLSDAVANVHHGHGPPMSESGPADLRSLARSFNDMQARIAGLEDDQARSFEAISHDLRTPLSRLKIASQFVSDSEIARLVNSSTEEMEAMLMSLQRFLRAEHLEAEPETLELTAMIRSMIAGEEACAALVGPALAPVASYREPLELALGPLIENALHYGSRVQVTLMRAGDGWAVEIADDGPGIDEAYFGRILDPFFRLDDARARDTAGFGLGIPTAYRLLERFGGALSFRNAPEGGLIVRVVVPLADASASA